MRALTLCLKNFLVLILSTMPLWTGRIRAAYSMRLRYAIRQVGHTRRSAQERSVKRPFNIIKIGLNRDRDELYERINMRVLDMMEQGLEQEARAMLPHRELNALNTVGYKEMFQYFDGAIPLEEAVRQIQSNSRRYARKQLTWYKRDAEIMWFNPENVNEITNYIDSRL